MGSVADRLRTQNGETNRGIYTSGTKGSQVTISRGQTAVNRGKQVTDTARPSTVGQSKNWIKSVGNTIGNVPGQVAGYANNNLVKPVMNWTNTAAKALTGQYDADLDRVGELRRSLDQDTDIIMKRYKAGKMSRQQYKDALAEVDKGYKSLGQENDRIMSQLEQDKSQFIKDTFVVATLPLAGGRLVATKAFKGNPIALRGAAINTRIMTNSVMSKIVGGIEDAIARIPGFKQTLEHNGAKFASSNKSELRQSVNAALVGGLLKQPFVYQASIGEVGEIMKDLDEQNYNGAAGRIAFTTSLFFTGGLFGLIRKGYHGVGNKINESIYGKQDVMAEISASLKGKNRAAYTEWLDEMEAAGKKDEAIKSLRIFQEQLLQRFGTAARSSEAIRDYIKTKGLDPKDITPKEFFNDEMKFINNWDEVTQLAKTGVIKNADGDIIRPDQIALGTFDQKTRAALIKQLADFKKKEDALAYVNDLRSEGKTFWAQNEYMFGQITKLINESKGPDKLAKAIKNIDAQVGLKGLPKRVADRLKKDGYIAIAPKSNVTKFIEERDTRKLISEYVNGSTQYFDETVAAKPLFTNAAAILHRTGLSAEAAQRTAYESLKKNVVSRLSEVGNVARFLPKNQKGNMTRAGAIVLHKLQKYAETRTPNKIFSAGGRMTTTTAISDIRQLTTKEIKEALAGGNFYLTNAEAKEVKRAINQGYMDVSLELRGIGEKFVDTLFRYVPGYSAYNRAQSALRYNYNPFFRLQEITETSILTKAEAKTAIWGVPRKQLNDVAAKLDKNRVLTTGFTGEGARDDVTLGRITASLTRSQKRNLAGLTIKMAEKSGYDLAHIDDYIRNHYSEIEDGLKTIVQYPSKGWLNSPMAKTINIAFFPMRYNLKVAGLTAKILSKQPPVVQLAVLNGIYDANKWLKSDEGLLWQSENSEALRLLQWLTPIGSIQSLFQVLNMRPDSISSVGQLGGLPAGLIFQTLDSNGAFNNLPIEFNTPYVDQKTGEIYPDKIPTNMRGRAAVALTDFMNSVFTYPGRTIGLPGKNAAVREVANAVTQSKNSDYEYIVREEDLTELQRRQRELLLNKDLDKMTDDELLVLFTNEEGLRSTPNLGVLFGVPKVEDKTLQYKNGQPVKFKKAQEKFSKL